MQSPNTLSVPNIDRVTDSCFNPEGTLLGFLYFDGAVRVYELDEHQQFTFIAQTASLSTRATSISFASIEIGPIFVVGDERGHSHVFQRAKVAEFSGPVTLETNRGAINSVAFSPSTLSFATASSDGHLSFATCDMKQWSIYTVRVSEAPVTSISWSSPAYMTFIDAPNGTEAVKLVAGSADGFFTLFEQRANSPLVPARASIAAHAGAVNSVAWRPFMGVSRTEIATAGADNFVRLWTIGDDAAPVVICQCEQEPLAVKWSPCGFLLSVSSGTATVAIWREISIGVWEMLGS
jgi:protein transport protein SEC13